MKIVTVDSIQALMESFSFLRPGVILESGLEEEVNECDACGRKIRDAEVLTTIAANVKGTALEIGTSHGRETFKIASNLASPYEIYTVNITPEQFEKDQKNVTHILSKEEIGAFYREKKCDRVCQLYADTLRWEPPTDLDEIAMAYVDGCHDRTAVYNDSKLAWDRLLPGGFLIWHDFNPELRTRYPWIDAAMGGVEDFVREYGLAERIVHLKHSWMGVIRKTDSISPLARDIRLGIVLDRSFYEQRKWVCALTPYLVEALFHHFTPVMIDSQGGYEQEVEGLDALVSFDPGWAAPVLEYTRTDRLRRHISEIPSYIFFSDFHARKWRENYFLQNNFTKIASYYYSPLFYNFTQIRPDQVLHMPWAVPDFWIPRNPVRLRGSETLCCFGATVGEAYDLRNWIRTFPFVYSTSNSGCENKTMSDKEFFAWLAEQDAAVAAGSDALKYQMTLPKYFEIAATGSLLFAQNTPDLAMLGFEHQRNCLIFDRNSFEPLALEYLRDKEHYLPLRKAGREMIRRRHTVSVRMRSLAREIRESIAMGMTQSPPLAIACITEAQEEQTISHSDQMAYDKDSKKFAYWFKKICIPEVLELTERAPIQVNGKPLEWEVAHEIAAFNLFDPSRSIAEIIRLSLARYSLLDTLWPGEYASAGEVSAFYEKSAEVLPWGHDIFLPDHNTVERRRNWLRRVAILSQLKEAGAVSVLDYGAGGGHTTLAALAMGFERVGHLEFSVFHPFVQWRLARTPGLNAKAMRFIDPRDFAKNIETFDAVICSDVAEHVYDYNELLRNIRTLLRPDGLLYWVSVFGENISCHLHPELRGKEEELLERYKFFKIGESVVNYEGYSGLFRKDTPPAEKYESVALFPSPNAGHKEQTLFRRPAEVYLASADRMDNVLHNAAVLRNVYGQGVSSYATVIGGLSGLNYINVLRPERITFFDVNPSMVEYCSLILELIGIADSPEDFITRIFARDVQGFASSRGQQLQVASQADFLAVPPNKAIYRDTLLALSPTGRALYDIYIRPHHSGEILPGIRNCRQLLPCWPEDRTVPVGGGKSLGKDSLGELVPNVNTFFYGLGWLESRASFLAVKSIVGRANISCITRNILQESIDDFFMQGCALALHVSNIDDWFPDKYNIAKSSWLASAARHESDFLAITSHNGVFHEHKNPHCIAYESIKKRVYGSIVEITTKKSWGFHEFERTVVVAEDYLSQDIKRDTTILHIIVGEGKPLSLFKSVLEKSMQQSDNILILEHNKDSSDWANISTPMLSLQELIDISAFIGAKHGFTVKEALPLLGEEDDARNVLLVLHKNWGDG